MLECGAAGLKQKEYLVDGIPDVHHAVDLQIDYGL
jgi:hypothetical protein